MLGKYLADNEAREETELVVSSSEADQNID